MPATARRPITGGARALDMQSLLTRTTWSGSHEAAGIVLAIGPGIQPGRPIDDAHILDVAPTILALLGYPVADDMDGRVLTGLFRVPPAVTTVASYDAAMPLRLTTARASDDGLDDRLRALGYVR